MNLQITTVETTRDLKTFVKFPYTIYAKCLQWIPPLIRDEMARFTPSVNPAYEQAETMLFMAYADHDPVGRIAAVLSHGANQRYKTKNMRFGWLDTIEDYAVAEALFDAVLQWSREKGMETMTGPHGFSNFDPQGMLIEGFDQQASIHATYNYPYYHEFVKRYGFVKEVDYVEIKSSTAESRLDRRYLRIKDRIEKRNDVKVLPIKSKKEAIRASHDVMKMLNDEYRDIYGVFPYTEQYIDYVTKKFISLINPDLISLAVDGHDRFVGALITIPSLTKAFKRANGRLFPFGWYHIMRGLKKNDRLDFLLIAAKEEYRMKGVPILMLADLAQRAMDMGYKSSESAPMLENNLMVHSLHKYFESVIHKRRRVFKTRVP